LEKDDEGKYWNGSAENLMTARQHVCTHRSVAGVSGLESGDGSFRRDHGATTTISKACFVSGTPKRTLKLDSR